MTWRFALEIYRSLRFAAEEPNFPLSFEMER